MSKFDETCTRCDGQMFKDAQDDDAQSCLQCGNMVYVEVPAPYETDRRSRTDNRQVTKPFREYRKTMSASEFEEKFKEVLDEKALKELMEEPT